ncbi:acyl-CoA dehydrogenase [Sporosarcina sp. ANT_H38]|uniref:acyl-CoA dehydrogenase family protein n=1 Tax=Sporosarcina sp. ANT_H38 TaxID=2597358 RepID=UPI0011F32AA9|nr:acyl-CoA dehydrogenase family protein [Sporosarcina sp. ANT_H38]KAA0965202.1 acyl-CoA dehydrogenase [Sporosarcina sp. ANT_H38]
MTHWMFTEEHNMFRNSVKKFVEKEITPFVEEWEEAGEVPRSVFERVGELGYLGTKFPVEYGGAGSDLIMDAIFNEELTKCGSGGIGASIVAHIGIALTPIWRFGNHEQKLKYLQPGVEGKKIAALGITEPNAGSDVSSIGTKAVDKGDHYLLNGSKTFITNGVNADYVVVAAKTADGSGHRNMSLFIVESTWEGFSVGKKLDKLGWRGSDTGELYFENVKVPKENLIGRLNEGFKYIMINFQWERLTLALSSIALAEKALEDTVRYSKERIQFGGPLAQFQVLRHKMVDMAIDIEKARSITYRTVYRYDKGQDVTTEATMAKAYAAEMVSRVCDQALQIHGGNGYMMEYPVQRYWRDARLQSIGGGTTQIMNEILTKRLQIIEN